MTKTVRKPGKSARHQVPSWSDYNESLVDREHITLRFDETITENWRRDSGGQKAGRPFICNDSMIECLLILKAIFG